VIEEISYTYDANGQRTVKIVGTPNLQDTTFTAGYDAANRMMSITLNPGTAGQKTYNLTYDHQGNLSQKQSAAVPSEITLYTWDARNRLTGISMTEGGQTSEVAFKYDAVGRRIERSISQGASFQRRQYVYDGIQAVGELVEGRVAATVVTGVNIDEVIARTVNVSGGQNPILTKTYLTDALGSVLAITLQNQHPELFYSYSPYGETSQLGGDLDSSVNSNQYTARENDGTVGGTIAGSLYYYRARYYDPVLKRFISEDPIGLEGGLNVYSYVQNNPVSFSDPLGLMGFGGGAGNRSSSASYGFGGSGGYRWNGNIYGEFEPQNSICDPPANRFNDKSCVVNCCVAHDACYENLRCNASSWWVPLPTRCQACNFRAMRCVAQALLNCDGKPCQMSDIIAP
jgi:RHS repeat-associated protein